MRVLRTLLKRIGWGLVTLWGVSLITFTLLMVLPADPAQTMGGQRATEETLKNIRRERGLDQPRIVQYYRYIADLCTNNLKSYRNSDRVVSAIARRFPATLLLALSGMAIWLVIAIPLGMATARRDGTLFDRTAFFIGIIALSIPTFWLGRLLQHYFAYRWGIFSAGIGANLWNLPLPALTLGLGGAAYYARLLHGNLRGVLRQDYIRATRARGVSDRQVVFKHALKNSMIPLITILGMDFASLLSGLIFTENIFGWPGIGSLAINSIKNQDAPMIMGTVLFASLMVITANILIDVVYSLIDPRIRVE